MSWYLGEPVAECFTEPNTRLEKQSQRQNMAKLQRRVKLKMLFCNAS